MRLISWNCSPGPFDSKASLLTPLRPDVMVLQECMKPAIDSADTLWFGDDSKKRGIGIQVVPPYSLAALPIHPDAPKYVVPVRVTGPKTFTLFAVWTLGKQSDKYIRAVAKAIGLYRHLIEDSDTVVMGDFNSNAMWDREHPADRNHSAVVTKLADLGLVSAYHHVRRESHGKEAEHTFHLYRRAERSYHIDYCFVPKDWATRITAVDIGAFERWISHSDHRPLIVDLED